MPPFVQEAFGGALVASFGGLTAFGFFYPVVMLTLSGGAIYMASEIAGDVEEGLVDLIAARAVPRHVIVTRSALVSGGVRLIPCCAHAPDEPHGSGVARARRKRSAAHGGGALIALNLLAVVWCFGAAGLALAAHARRRNPAAGTIGLAAVVLYLLHFAAASWAPARPFARLSPFHYYEGMRTLMGLNNPGRDIATLLAATAGLLACAYVLYARRDL